MEVAVMKLFAFVSPLMLLGAATLFIQENPSSPPFKVPPELVGKSNPVKPSAEGMAHARKMWGYDCAMCHGANGDGKGDLAADMKPPMKDYQNPAALKDISDGELFYIVKQGKGQMPSEGDRAKDADLWNMVSLVRSFADKK
jgi:mono/diheme cytochrome c family protein